MSVAQTPSPAIPLTSDLAHTPPALVIPFPCYKQSVHSYWPYMPTPETVTEWVSISQSEDGAGTESSGRAFESQLKTAGKGAAEALLQDICPWEISACGFCALLWDFLKHRR